MPEGVASDFLADAGLAGHRLDRCQHRVSRRMSRRRLRAGKQPTGVTVRTPKRPQFRQQRVGQGHIPVLRPPWHAVERVPFAVQIADGDADAFRDTQRAGVQRLDHHRMPGPVRRFPQTSYLATAQHDRQPLGSLGVGQPVAHTLPTQDLPIEEPHRADGGVVSAPTHAFLDQVQLVAAGLFIAELVGRSAKVLAAPRPASRRPRAVSADKLHR